MRGEVEPCGRVNKLVRESMMKLLLDGKRKRNDAKRRKEEFEECLRGDDVEVENVDNSNDDQLRFVTQERALDYIMNGKIGKDRFRHETRGYQNVYEQGGSSRASVSGGGRPIDLSFFFEVCQY
ncbi:hypothetical protein P8452_48245 [Trifolium repens]|nr:hypothetical protein P8452_48245 [Trifolium repens]